MTPTERETAAFEIMEEMWAAIMRDNLTVAAWLNRYPDRVPEDVTVVAALIKDGWDMFQEIWAKAI